MAGGRGAGSESSRAAVGGRENKRKWKQRALEYDYKQAVRMTCQHQSENCSHHNHPSSKPRDECMRKSKRHTKKEKE